MSTYIDASTIFRTESAMLDALCSRYITSGGTISDQDAKALVCELTAEQLVDDLLENWGTPTYVDDDREEVECDREDLIASMHECWLGFMAC